MADETLYVFRHLCERIASSSAFAALGYGRRDVFPDGPPPGRTVEGRPYVVVQLQAAGSTTHSAGGRALSEPLFVTRVVSGGDALRPGAESTAYDPFAAAPLADAVADALEDYQTILTLPDNRRVALTVRAEGAVMYPEANSGTRYNHAGRIWRVMLRPDGRG